jgi:hypothetical protein
MLSLEEFIVMLNDLRKEEVVVPGDIALNVAATTSNAMLFVEYSSESGIYRLGIEIAEDIKKSEGNEENIYYVCHSRRQDDLIEQYEAALKAMLTVSSIYAARIKAVRNDALKFLTIALRSQTNRGNRHE